MRNPIQILFFALAWTIAAPASAQTLSGSGTAVIDGVIDSEEWADADAPIFLVDLPDGDVAGAALYVMNDATNLYLGLAVVYAGGSVDLSVEFDASGDGQTLGEGDDAIGYSTGSGIARDTFRTGISVPFDTSDGGTLNVVGDHSTSATATWIELAHPFSGSDTAHDIDVGGGDLLPFYVRIRLSGEPDDAISFYPGPAAGIEAQIQIVPEPGSALSIAVGVGAIAWRCRRQRESR